MFRLTSQSWDPTRKRSRGSREGRQRTRPSRTFVEARVDTGTVEALLAAHNLGCAVPRAHEVVPGPGFEPISARTANKEIVSAQAN